MNWEQTRDPNTHSKPPDVDLESLKSPANDVRDGIYVDPPLCRGTSQGVYMLRIMGLVCEGGTVGKIGQVDEMGERELVLVVSVRCGKERDMTRG